MYQEKKQNMNQNANENKRGADIRVERIELGNDAFDKLGEIIGGVLIDSMMNQLGDNADAMLGWLARRAGNQEPINGHKLDNLKMEVDNDHLTLKFPEVGCYIVVDDGTLTVENLRRAVRAVFEHDRESLWQIAGQMADEMCEE